MMAGDIFDPTPGSPVKRPSSTLGFAIAQEHPQQRQQVHQMMEYDLHQPLPMVSHHHYLRRMPLIANSSSLADKAYLLLGRWDLHPKSLSSKPLPTSR
jgi:hypothetical protein